MTAEDAGREGLTGRKKANRWRISRRRRLFFSVDAELDEAGKANEGGEKRAADRRNAGLPRMLCLFVDLKDSRLAVRHTLNTVASPSAAVTVFHSLLSAVIPASLKCFKKPDRSAKTDKRLIRPPLLHPNGNKKPYSGIGR